MATQRPAILSFQTEYPVCYNGRKNLAGVALWADWTSCRSGPLIGGPGPAGGTVLGREFGFIWSAAARDLIAGRPLSDLDLLVSGVGSRQAN